MRPRDERGVTMVLFALLLVCFCMFTAFALDLGGAFNQRRQTQSGADAGALGAAQDLPSTTSTVTQVINLVNLTLGTTFTAADWQTPGCTDADALSQRPAGYECISFDDSFSRIRVKVPMAAPYQTTFARVIGINQLNISAVAEARRRTSGFGGVLPFGIPPAGAGSGQICLKTGTSGHIDSQPPCNGPVTGNFGFVDMKLYGNSALNTTASCNNGGTSARLIQNIGVGGDHLVSPWGGTTVNDTCFNISPNTLDVATGMTSNAFDAGILTGGGTTDFSDGGVGRLRRVGDNSGDYYTRVTSIHGLSTTNDTGLWEFMPASQPANTPDSCAKSVFTTALTDGNLNNKDQLRGLLDTCFADYSQVSGPVSPGCSTQPCAGALFSNNSRTESPVDLYDIQLNPRFGYVPRLMDDFPSGGSGTVRVASFQPVYIQRLFAGCGGNCSIDFEPGVGNGNQNANQKAEAITAFAIAPSMLPGQLGTNPFALNVNQFIELVRAGGPLGQ